MWRTLPLLMTALAACTGPAGKVQQPGVVLVTLCTFRADRLGACGYPRDTSPNLDALARESVLFERALANGTWTLSSHGSILSGLFPAHHGLLHEGHTLADVPTLPEVLALYGYRTAADIQEPGPASIGGGHGLTRDFQSVWTTEHHSDWSPDRIADWAAEEDGPFLALVHLRESHYPYGDGPPFADDRDPRFEAWVSGNKPGMNRQPAKVAGPTPGDAYATFLHQLQQDPALRENLAALYDSGVREADESIGELIAALEDRDLLDRSVVVVVAGHGEELGENNNLGHKVSFADPVVHVPLLIRLPGGRGGGARVGEVVSQVDLFPTLAQLTGATPPASLDGRSLVPALEGGALEPRTTAVQMVGGSVSELKLQNLVVDGDYRLFLTEGPPALALFPGSGRGQPLDIGEHRARVARMEGWLRSSGAGGAPGEVRAFSEEEIRELREKGYW